jgi:hypothetical protein
MVSILKKTRFENKSAREITSNSKILITSFGLCSKFCLILTLTESCTWRSYVHAVVFVHSEYTVKILSSHPYPICMKNRVKPYLLRAI